MDKKGLLMNVIDASTHAQMDHAIEIAIADVFAQIVIHILLAIVKKGFIILLKREIV
jgi:hypothetical protein